MNTGRRTKSKSLAILIVAVIVISSFSPIIVGSADRKGIKKHSVSSLDRLKTRLYNFLVKLKERNPKLGSLPFFERLLNVLNPFDDMKYRDTQSSETDDQEEINDSSGNNNENNVQNDDSNSDNGQQSTDSDSTNRGNGENNDGNSINYVYPSLSDPSEEVSIMSEKDSLNVSDNATLIPKKGHFTFIGHGNIDLNLVFNLNGTIVVVTGHLYIGPNTGTVDILWNVKQGYFEMTGNGTFRVTDFYFNVNNSLIFMAASLEISANGHVLINRADSNGELYLDGVVDVSSLSFDVGVEQTNFSIGGSLSFSGNADAHELHVSWWNEGFSLNGSFDENSRLDIDDFHVTTPQFSIATNLITLYTSAEFNFESIDGNTICIISADHLEISGLDVLYGNKTTHLDTITVTGTLSIVLHIDPNSYVSTENGHITISGNAMMSINTTVNINGTVVAIKGEFSVESAYDSIDIWWNKTTGYFLMNCTSILKVGDFYLDINGTWLQMQLENLILNPGAYIKIDNENGTKLMIGGGSVNLRGLVLRATLQNSSISLRLDSLHFDLSGYLEVIAGEEETKLSANTVFGHSLTMQDLQLSVAGFSVSAGGIALDGFWEIVSDGENISLDVMGDLKVSELSAYIVTENETSPLIEMDFLDILGEAGLTVGGGILEAWVYGGGYIKAGASVMGPFSLALLGDAHIVMYLETGEIYGEFGFAGSVLIMGLSVGFDGEGTFNLVNSSLQISVTGHFRTYVPVGISFHIDNLIITVHGGANVIGEYSAYVLMNLRTGDIYAAVNVGISILASITHIRIYGEDINIDEHDWEDFGISEDSDLYFLKIHVGSIDINVNGDISAAVVAAVGLTISGEGMNMGLGFGIGPVNGSMDWVANIRDIEIYYKDNFLLQIGSIDSDGTFSLTAFPLITTEDAEYGIGAGLGFSIDGTVTINDFRVTATSENASLNVSFDQISVDVEGDLKLLYYGNGNGAFAINGTGNLNVEGIEFEGSFNGTNVTASLGLFNFTAWGTLVAYGNGTLTAAGGISLDVEDVSIDVENVPFIGNMSVDIEYITLYLDAYLSIQPQKDGSTTYSFLGYVEFNTTFYISGDNFNVWGNVTADGLVYVYIANGSTGNLTYVEIAADMDINDIDICMGGTINLFGSDVDWSFNLVNYSGDGLLKIKFDFINNSFYMANFQEDAHWDVFNFSFGPLLAVNVSTFYGDLRIDNFFIDNHTLENLTGEFTALGWIFEILFAEPFNLTAYAEVFQGWLDPDNWIIHSENGFEVLFGIDFYSKYGLLFAGDVDVYYGTFHLYQLYCAPGTDGRFEVSVDEHGDFIVTIHTYSGYAQSVIGITFGGTTYYMSINSETGEYYLPVGTMLTIFDDILDGEWNQLVDDLEQFLNLLNDPSVLEALKGTVNAAGVPISQMLLDLLQGIIDDSSIPKSIKDQLIDIIEEIEEKLREILEESCFLAGTKIEMADGTTKNIEDIQVGDKVKSFDTRSKTWRVGTVTKVFH
ncbi:MAG: hypothetical protein J7K13_02155, partial [Thermoplasmata archaeon]|nr:hypothetical protein [Thermoplasmata archaeon]